MSAWIYSIIDSKVDTYMDYLGSLFSRRSLDAEAVLKGKLLAALSLRRRVDRTFRIKEELFSVRAYVLGCDVSLRSRSGIEVPIRIATNSSILIEGNSVKLFLRLSSLGGHPIPNLWSRTFIGVGEVSIDELRGRVKFVAKPLLYPIVTTERVEDPRVWCGDDGVELYHVRAYEPYIEVGGARSYVITFKSTLQNGEVREMEPVRIEDPQRGSEAIIRDYRDTFPMSKDYMIIRPWIEDAGVGGILVAPRDGSVVRVRDAIAYPELMPREGIERKTGSNCVVKVSSNEYLLVFHSVDRVWGTYHTYAALLSSDGELLGITEEPIISPRPHDYFGARPSTIFVCGASLVGNDLIVSAGKDDEITVILEAPLSKVIERMKFLRP